jgi:hypothetical protein
VHPHVWRDVLTCFGGSAVHSVQVEVKQVLHEGGFSKQAAWFGAEGVTAGETLLPDFLQPGGSVFVPVTNLRGQSLHRDGPQREVDGGKSVCCFMLQLVVVVLECEAVCRLQTRDGGSLRCKLRTAGHVYATMSKACLCCRSRGQDSDTPAAATYEGGRVAELV